MDPDDKILDGRNLALFGVGIDLQKLKLSTSHSQNWPRSSTLVNMPLLKLMFCEPINPPWFQLSSAGANSP